MTRHRQTPEDAQHTDAKLFFNVFVLNKSVRIREICVRLENKTLKTDKTKKLRVDVIVDVTLNEYEETCDDGWLC